jgi:NAD(P)-dependent dehydrogenase (short-subunit alcohol dehydrogenase family)
MKTAIAIGVGPDRELGTQLCKRFAAEGLKVIVAGRTKSAVEADRRSSGVFLTPSAGRTL